MQYKKMGRTGLKVSAFGMGTMFFGEQVMEADAIKIMDTAFDKGINLFDTANGYTEGRSEEIVGKALKNKRNQIVLATKVRYPQGSGPNDYGLSRKHILQAAEDSLRRLNTEYIDIYYAHAPDYTTPIEETLRAFDILVQQGKARYIACSNFRAWQLIQSLYVSKQYNLARFDCIQSPYNLITRDIETELLPGCAEEGVGVTVYNPLAAGLLTGKYNQTEAPATNTRFGLERFGELEKANYWSGDNFQAVAKFKQIAHGLGCNLPRFSLAWILNNPVVSSVIIGASSTKQLEENIGALDIKLTNKETEACDKIWLELRPSRVFYGR